MHNGGGSRGAWAGDAEGEPESDQDGDGHHEGHTGDAVPCGVDGLHCEEVRYLGSVQMGPSQKPCPWGVGGLTTEQVQLSVLPQTPHRGAGGIRGDPSRLPQRTEVFVFGLPSA